MVLVVDDLVLEINLACYLVFNRGQYEEIACNVDITNAFICFMHAFSWFILIMQIYLFWENILLGLIIISAKVFLVFACILVLFLLIDFSVGLIFFSQYFCE